MTTAMLQGSKPGAVKQDCLSVKPDPQLGD